MNDLGCQTLSPLCVISFLEGMDAKPRGDVMEMLYRRVRESECPVCPPACPAGVCTVWTCYYRVCSASFRWWKCMCMVRKLLYLWPPVLSFTPKLLKASVEVILNFASHPHASSLFPSPSLSLSLLLSLPSFLTIPPLLHSLSLPSFLLRYSSPGPHLLFPFSQEWTGVPQLSNLSK